MSERRYSRIFWGIVDDPKFADVYPSDRDFATWVRLLIIADQAYPAPAALPRTAKLAAVNKLVAAGIVNRVGSDHFRIHGMKTVREEQTEWTRRGGLIRASSGQRASSGRWIAGPPGVPAIGGPAIQLSNRTEQNRTEQREDALDTYYRLAARVPSKGARQWLLRLVSDYGDEETSAALATEWMQAPDPSTILGRTEARLDKNVRLAADEARRAAAERAAAERAAMAEMPEEQRLSNLARLRDMFRGAGRESP